MQKKTLSRRDFVRGIGFAVGASVLSACGAQAPATVIVKETVEVEKVVEKTVKETVKETVQVEVEVEKAVTVTPMPTAPPEPVVMDVWWNTDLPDLNKEWKADPENEEFKKQWYGAASAGKCSKAGLQRIREFR